jgi:hypothetical protein
LAFALALVRGWKNGTPGETALLTAWLGLVAMAGVGYLIGRLAQWIVEDSVRTRILLDLAKQQAAQKSAQDASGRSPS